MYTEEQLIELQQSIQLKDDKIKEMESDLKLIKNTVTTILKNTGFMADDGTMREGLDMKKIMSLGMKFATGDKKIANDFAEIKNILPLVEKYSYL